MIAKANNLCKISHINLRLSFPSFLQIHQHPPLFSENMDPFQCLIPSAITLFSVSTCQETQTLIAPKVAEKALLPLPGSSLHTPCTCHRLTEVIRLLVEYLSQSLTAEIRQTLAGVVRGEGKAVYLRVSGLGCRHDLDDWIVVSSRELSGVVGSQGLRLVWLFVVWASTLVKLSEVVGKVKVFTPQPPRMCARY